MMAVEVSAAHYLTNALSQVLTQKYSGECHNVRMHVLLSRRVGKSDAFRCHFCRHLQVTYQRRPWVCVVRGWWAVLFGCGRSVSFLLITLTPVIYKLHTDQIKNYQHILIHLYIRDLLSQKATGNSILGITKS